VSDLVWPVILRLPVEPHTIDLIRSLMDLERAAERLALGTDSRFLEDVVRADWVAPLSAACVGLFARLGA
jgi:hypothetical protein